MEENNFDLPTLKAVKKTTYNAIVNKAHLNINPENSPLMKDKGPRSQSSKRIGNFVPCLRPQKSRFIPAPLKLNKDDKVLINKEKDENNKQMSEDEIEIIDHEDDDDEDSSSVSSSEINSSDEDIEKIKQKEDQIREEKNFKNSSSSVHEKIEDVIYEKEYEDYELIMNEMKNYENSDKFNIEINKSFKILRKKLSQIRAKVNKNRYKETEEVIHNNLKNTFNIGLKKHEKYNEKPVSKYTSINIFENKDNSKSKSRTIFEVLSSSKKN